MIGQEDKTRRFRRFLVRLALISVPCLLMFLAETPSHAALPTPSLLEARPDDGSTPTYVAQFARRLKMQARAEGFRLLASEEEKERDQERTSAGEYGDVTTEEAEKGQPPAGEYGNVSGEQGVAGENTYIRDPLRGFNKAMFRFNDKFYFWVMQPATRGYKRVVPENFRVLFSNFYRNLTSPIRIINNLLQMKFKYAGAELARTVINTTVGVGGLRDCARDCFGIQAHNADFGQTLGFYGAGFGFYIVWPVLGPSSVRDTIGFAGDAVTTPTWYINYPYYASAGVYAHRKVNDMSFHLGEYESFKKATLDPYVAMRSAYVQNRKAAIEK